MNRNLLNAIALMASTVPALADGTYDPVADKRSRRGLSCKARAQRPGNRSDHLAWPGARKLMARA